MSIRSLPNAVSLEAVSSITSPKKLGERIKYIATHITVEPIVFFYILVGVMGLLTTQNLNLEKACRVNLQYNSSICDAMVRRDRTGYEKYHEAEVQKLVAKMLTIKTAVIGFFPTLLVLFFGSWSDRHMKRKPLILIPMTCDVLSGLGLLICAHFFMEIPIEYVLIADCFPFSLGGGWSCLFIGVFSYVSGLSSDEDRTIRIGTLSMVQNVAMTFGNVIGGISLKPLGLQGSYMVVDSVMLCALLYGFIIIKDTAQVNSTGHKNFLRDFFDISHVKNTFRMCFKEGHSNRKWKVIIIMMATALITGPMQGEMAVLYLYTRFKFGWNEVNYSLYSSLQFVVQILGSVFALSYFSKKLNLDDATLGLIAIVSKISACLLYSFAPSGEYFFAGCFVEIFHGTCYIALRSIMSKIVPPHELGQTNSVFGVCEAVVPLVFGPLYSMLYNYTIEIFPGAFYVVSAVLYSLVAPLFICLYKFNREEKQLKAVADKEAEQQENLLMKAMSNPRRKSIDFLKS